MPNSRSFSTHDIIETSATEIPNPIQQQNLPVPVSEPPVTLEPIAPPPTGLVVHNGAVYDMGDPGTPVAEVTDQRFAAGIDEIRNALDHARRTGSSTGLGVSREGRIVLNDNRAPGAPVTTPLTHVTRDRFAAAPSPAELAIVSRHLPADTIHSSQVPGWPPGQPDGWIVRTEVETGDVFEYLLHWSPLHTQYRALLISPALERYIGKVVTTNQIHAYPDGTMCITESIGTSSLADAYARSVLWCTGIAWSIRTGKPFPFHPNQAPLP